MSAKSGFDSCLPFIASEYQVDAKPRLAPVRTRHRLAVTISRQSGSGGHAVGEKLAEYLQSHAPKSPLPWMLFDRNLVERVLEDHKLPGRLVQFMPEDRVTVLTDMIQEMFGLHPPFWTLVHLTAETILHLAEQGNVILIGRGANLVTSKFDHVFHVRLVGSLAKRVTQIQVTRGLGEKAARDLVHQEDLGRQRYLRKYFHQDFDNPLLYHLVINTDLVSYEDAARLIGEAALHHLRQRMASASDHPVAHGVDSSASVLTRTY
jgi:cytidylate kinase